MDDRRLAGRAHLPVTHDTPEPFVTTDPGAIYLLISDNDVHCIAKLPGTAKVTLELDDRGGLVGLCLTDFSEERQALETFIREVLETVVVASKHPGSDEIA